MSYHRRPLSGLGATPTFSGDPNSLPICPQVSSTGWCRPYVGGSPQYRGTPDTVAGGSPTPTPPGSGPSASDVIGAFFKGLTGSIGTSTMTPAQAPVIVQAPSSGPSTTTILAIGGAALLAVILLRD